MQDSKEALENIKTAPSFMGGNPKYWANLQSSIPFLEDIEIIKKDLDKLEKLKKENKELRKSIKSWNENVGNLLKENIKLKKVIEFLDDKLDITLYKEVFSQDYYLDYKSSGKSRTAFPITKEQCELLKKALPLDNFENMFINCELTPLPELEELQDDK